MSLAYIYGIYIHHFFWDFDAILVLEILSMVLFRQIIEAV